MKLHTSNVVSALLALVLGSAISAMAQQPSAQTAPKPQAESCCAMDSCCGSGESCAMHKDGATQAADTKGCCCSGDSCDMKKHDGSSGDMKMEGSCCEMKHDGAAGDMKHDGSCCNMKQKDKQKDKQKETNKQKPA